MDEAAIKNRTIFLFFSLLGVIVYSNTFNAPFHFDDFPSIIGNPAVRSIAVIGSRIMDHYSAVFTARSFLTFTFGLNYLISGFDPISYHAVNLLIHIANAFLLYLLFFKYVEKDTSRGYSPKFVLVAALFLVLPINTESVTYISSRSSLLSAFFILTSTHCFFKATSDRFSVVFYITSLLLFLLGLATKEAAIVLPLLILLFDYFFISGNARRLFSRFKYYLPHIAIVICLFVAYASFDLSSSLDSSRTWKTHIFTEMRVFMHYLTLSMAPIGLSVDHDVLPSTTLDGYVAVSLVALGVLLIGSMLLRKRRPILSISILWFLLALAPHMALRLNDFMAERWAYTATMGLCVGFAEILMLITIRYKQLGIALIGTVMIMYGAATLMRNQLYSSPVLLWSDAVSKAPEKERPCINLSNAYRENGDLTKAIAYAQMGISNGLSRGGTDFSSFMNLAVAYQDNGDFIHAAEVLKSVETYASGRYDYYLDLGSVYLKLERYDEAFAAIERSLEIHPDAIPSLLLVGECYDHSGRPKRARAFYSRAIQGRPANAPEYLAQARAFLKLGSAGPALQCLYRGVGAHPLDAKLRLNLAEFLLENGHAEEAYEQFSALSEVSPSSVAAYKGMGSALLKKGDSRGAKNYFSKALSLLPFESLERKELLGQLGVVPN